jgi:predicted lipid-binding transport protein (Tim44 family)
MSIVQTTRRRVKLRLRHVRHQRREAAARRREAALERRARAFSPQAQWDSDELRRLVTEAFDPIQRRWRPHDAQLSRAYVSDALHDRHRRELEQLEARHQTMRVVVSSFDDVALVGVAGATGGDALRAVAQVRFRAYETLMDSRSARVIDGVPRKRRALREDWTLVWHPTRGWLIDDIQRRQTRRASARSVIGAAWVTPRSARAARDRPDRDNGVPALALDGQQSRCHVRRLSTAGTDRTRPARHR